jgi:hypothetical protein
MEMAIFIRTWPSTSASVPTLPLYLKSYLNVGVHESVDPADGLTTVRT